MRSISMLKRLFPPPAYMTLPAVGIDVSDTSVKYVQLRMQHGSGHRLALRTWGETKVAEGIITDGNIVDVAGMSTALKQIRKEVRTPYARVALPEERAYIFETHIKRGTPFSEVRGMLEFKLEENVPLSPRDAYFDYAILDDEHDAEQLRVVVSVYARETIEAYYQAFRAAGFFPVAFEVEAAGVARAIIPKDTHDTCMVVDFGKTRMGVGIVHDGTLMYTSTIDIGGDALSAAMRDVLGEDVAEEKLTDIKNTQGLTDTAKEYAPVRTALTAICDELVEQLRAQVSYWDSRELEEGQRRIGTVLFCGGSANLAGFPEYMTKELDIPVQRADVWSNTPYLADDADSIPKRYAFGYATCLGLALAGYTYIHS